MLAGIGRRVEGVHAVRAALAAGRVEKLLVEPRRLDALSDLVGQVELELVDDVRERSMSSAPQGVLAECRPRSTLTLAEVVSRADRPALMMLDHVEDPHNVGAVARSAGAAGIDALVVAERRSAPLGPVAFKAAAGALEHLGICVVKSIADAVVRLKKLDVWTVALTAGGDTSVFGLQLLTEPVALIAGGEGRGVSRLVAERADVLASIPMKDDIESLNVSVAAALAMFEVGRIRTANP